MKIHLYMIQGADVGFIEHRGPERNATGATVRRQEALDLPVRLGKLMNGLEGAVIQLADGAKHGTRWQGSTHRIPSLDSLLILSLLNANMSELRLALGRDAPHRSVVPTRVQVQGILLEGHAVMTAMRAVQLDEPTPIPPAWQVLLRFASLAIRLHFLLSGLVFQTSWHFSLFHLEFYVMYIPILKVEIILFYLFFGVSLFFWSRLDPLLVLARLSFQLLLFPLLRCSLFIVAFRGLLSFFVLDLVVWLRWKLDNLEYWRFHSKMFL